MPCLQLDTGVVGAALQECVERGMLVAVPPPGPQFASRYGLPPGCPEPQMGWMPVGGGGDGGCGLGATRRGRAVASGGCRWVNVVTTRVRLQPWSFGPVHTDVVSWLEKQRARATAATCRAAAMLGASHAVVL